MTISNDNVLIGMKQNAVLNDATEVVAVREGHVLAVSIDGTFNGTVALQRRFDDTDNWRTYASYTVPTELDVLVHLDSAWRLVYTVATSGNPNLRIQRSKTPRY